MKIDSSRIFIADIYKAKGFVGRITDFEYPKYTPILQEQNVILINYKHFYIPLKYFKNMITRLSLKIAILKGSIYKDERFLSTELNDELIDNMLYIQNLEPLFKDGNKKYSIEKLEKLQIVLNSIKNSNRKEALIIDPTAL